MNNPRAIELHANVIRNAGKAVLHNVHLNIEVGEVVALVGPNGGGKSTLIFALAGDNNDSDFELKLFGSDVRGFTAGELARVRSVIEQKVAALVGYPVSETVSWGGFSRTLNSIELKKIVQESLDYFNISDIQASRIDAISGGQWARVLLARAATQAAPLLIADEPDAALDSESTRLMYQWLAKTQTTAVIATHDVLAAQKYAHRILRVESGQVTES